MCRLPYIRIAWINPYCGKILKLINGLNPHKAHGQDGIYIRMLRLYNLTRTKPPSIVNKNCLQQGFFPDDWKKGSIIPVHNKDSKQILNNYRPVSLLPIYTKSFEKLIFDSIYEFIDKNNLFKSNQSEFRRNDSCIYISLFSLYITFLVHLTLTTYWKFVTFFLIYLKHVIEFAMTIFFINSRVMELII